MRRFQLKVLVARFMAWASTRRHGGTATVTVTGPQGQQRQWRYGKRSNEGA